MSQTSTRLMIFALVFYFVISVSCMRYDPDFVDFNLNQNESATVVLDYWGEWHNHTYHPSPDNWRMPFYTLFLDRFVNGDPTNDNANGTAWEHDLTGTQLRHGGDVRGLQDSLDYLASMGIKGLYLAGSPFINKPWSSDSYSPLDFTLLDEHFGSIQAWRDAITEIHAHGMYVVLDNTMATMGDLIGFKGYLNTSAPFYPKEHEVLWKWDRRYLDWEFGMDYIEHCDYPRFYGDDGLRRYPNVTNGVIGCRDSDFDQYGEIGAFDEGTEWRRQLSKFAYVQDRLREWRPDVRERIQHLSCIQIAMLDVDGFRMDKGIQITVDAQADFADYLRSCAKRYGKTNFFIPGEIVSGNALGAVYIGRGKEPSMKVTNLTAVASGTGAASQSNSTAFIRDQDKSAFDGATFHYTIYRSLLRFLGMDGSLAAGYDVPVNWVEGWHGIMATNDMANAITGEFDPRHMYGTSNQDTFRWPGIVDGTHKQILGHFVTTLILPGIPLLTWGEEQAFYVYDNTAANYVYGRQSMSSALAWQDHGCYKVGNSKYINFPLKAAANGCKDEMNILDHRDPTHPVRSVLRIMFELRSRFSALNDGVYLQQLSNHTWDLYLPGSEGAPTETGLWSSVRKGWPGVQDLSSSSGSSQDVWLLYTNENSTKDYKFDCSNESALIAPFEANVTVRNLFWPWEEYTTEMTSVSVEGINGTALNNSCISTIQMQAWSFKALVPKEDWTLSSPIITAFSPGHDARVFSSVSRNEKETIPIKLSFSQVMDCIQVLQSLNITSKTEFNETATVNVESVRCTSLNSSEIERPKYAGFVPTLWTFEANLTNVYNGVHTIAVLNATSQNNTFTNSVDKFMIRVGQHDNPMVFPRLANYTNDLLFENPSNGTLYISQKAAGADKYRYSLNWGSSYSKWTDYVGGNIMLKPQSWSGTSRQAWSGPPHVIVQYWSKATGSSDHLQHADLYNSTVMRKRYPHFFLHGEYNQYGYDSGLQNTMKQISDSQWSFNFMTEWPTLVQLNAWGMNPDGRPDQTVAFGDVDGDFILDRISPDSLLKNVINITAAPPSSYLGYQIKFNDGSLRYELIPHGSAFLQGVVICMLFFIPIITGALGCYIYLKSFYQVKLNMLGLNESRGTLGKINDTKEHINGWIFQKFNSIREKNKVASGGFSTPVLARPPEPETPRRRCVLIATMEYNIPDWDIKIKIGGLGVMAQLMGKNLGHLDLVWVVPCVGDIEYPQDKPLDPIVVTVLGKPMAVNVQCHKTNNVTYVLLDAPVFRNQTQKHPYPPRMDDFNSAVYYSAWNQCIAESITRFHVDLYHINDYHGSLAPLYLLPKTIPCCLSLHNAEFQGLWPMRTPTEVEEVCGLYNLPEDVVQKYVQFGEVFNLLHAGASYLRIHQKGFGAVGVSQKYGKRSFARYPIFWGLGQIGSLPNPDPDDTADYNRDCEPKPEEISINIDFETSRGDKRKRAQEWAGLNINPKADLFVFVGRWSLQKGVDLIADVFPDVLERYPSAQLIAIGPIIDLYGKFAARKLDRLMNLYPGRVYSKPEFTQLPSEVFSGAEFALIPSRDEPFGLVALEFGRKGALGVGARVGGLGTLPGWWYTVESTTTKHLLKQFKSAIENSLASTPEKRAIMRAHAAKQRFPVIQWKSDLEKLQEKSIKAHYKRNTHYQHGSLFDLHSASSTPHMIHSPDDSDSGVRCNSDQNVDFDPASCQPLSLGLRTGPGHQRQSRKRKLNVIELAKKASMVSLRGKSHSKVNQSTHSLKISSPIPIPEDWSNSPAYQNPRSLVRSEYSLASSRAAANASSLVSSPNMISSEILEENSLSPDPTEPEEYFLTSDQVEISTQHNQLTPQYDSSETPQMSSPNTNPVKSSRPDSPGSQSSPFDSQLSIVSGRPANNETHVYQSTGNVSACVSQLRLSMVCEGRQDYKLQNVDPFFTDSTEEYYDTFGKKLEKLNGKTSETSLCIEEYIMKSEKDWFNRYHDAKMRKVLDSDSGLDEDLDDSSMSDGGSMAQFRLSRNYVPPTGLKKLLHRKFGDWPIYAFFLAFGQIIGASSYQITLLTGEVGESAIKLYAVASIYLAFSIVWWAVFRLFKSVYVLSIPFLVYGSAFFILGAAPWVEDSVGKGWVQNVATGLYAAASASSSCFFALNFGAEGSAPVESWSFRACVIQGTQQVYVVALWYWGAKLTNLSTQGTTSGSLVLYGWPITAITVPLGLMLWSIAVILFLGLPDYYRQAPGAVPSFYSSIFRRKVVLWFFASVILQNFFMSSNYGRMWLYLWSSQHIPTWVVVLLIACFFIGLWSAFLYAFSRLSTTHSWILPIFSLGLGAPRWCQMLWATSGIGCWIPWAGSATGGAIVARILWLWLGLLDTLQGVGIGMILLQTLTRFHMTFTLISAQVVGSVATIVARACAPNKIGPGPVFPNFATADDAGLGNAWFWAGLLSQLAISAGFFKFFRKEQLSKP